VAIINKNWLIFTLLVLSAVSSIAHTIYAPNDIPLLDNRFRIDPNTEQLTIILNHPSDSQKVILVQPDGSKLYAQRHPEETVAWFNNSNQDIITIQNPMPGPWQAIATLNGENRIQLLNPITLKINRLPLKVYNSEYLTSYISLIKDGQVMTNKDFLKHAKLTVSILSDKKKLLSLYRDDGQYYDSLPFDGQLSTHFFMDLPPGRYLLNIKTKNNIFIRNVNKDIVVFPRPLIHKVQQKADGTSDAELTFTVDETEIDPNSVTVNGMFTRIDGSQNEQSIVHFSEQKLQGNSLTIKVPLAYQAYTYLGKVFATTNDGREISFQLPEQNFELIAAATIEAAVISDALLVASQENTITSETQVVAELAEQPFQYIWVIIISITVFSILCIVVAVLLIRRKRKNLIADKGLSLDELIIDGPLTNETDEK